MMDPDSVRALPVRRHAAPGLVHDARLLWSDGSDRARRRKRVCELLLPIDGSAIAVAVTD